jgi:hypothetical protein
MTHETFTLLQGEGLIAGGTKLSESVNKVVRFEDLITASVKMAV